MFIPNRFKYKKQQKGKKIAKIKNSFCKIYKNNNKTYLKSLQYGHMTVNHLKTLKLQISKNIKKSGRLVFEVFPQTPVTKKPIEVRMGKGKGNVDRWVVKIKPGVILCYIEGNSQYKNIKALRSVQLKLPIKTKIII